MDSNQRVRAILSFVQAAEHGSFAGAARSLGVSAAAVSKNVAGLERSLGVRLMNRTTRSLHITTEGEVFLERARVALDALDDAIDIVLAQRAEPTGRVRMSTTAIVGNCYVLPLIPALTKRYPALSLEIDFDDRRVDLVRDGYDFAIRGGVIQDSGLISRRICTLNTVLVASPAYLAAHGVPKHRDDLARHRTIALRFLNGWVCRWYFNGSDGQVEELEPASPAVMVSAPEAAVEAAVLGLGIAQVGVHSAWEYLCDGRLKALLTEQHNPGTLSLELQYPHRALLAPRVRVTVEFLLDGFEKTEALHVPLEVLREFTA